MEDSPFLEIRYNYNGISFSSSPMSPDCVFFVVNSNRSDKYVGIYTWQHREDDWIERDFEYQVPFSVAHNNPILLCGMFYCLRRKGNLAVFDPGCQDHEGREFCYLVELAGRLVSVFMRNSVEPPRVLKLDEKQMTWVEVQEIDGVALFLDRRASYSVGRDIAKRWCGNRIYFPRFSEDGKQLAFYDMETACEQGRCKMENNMHSTSLGVCLCAD